MLSTKVNDWTAGTCHHLLRALITIHYIISDPLPSLYTYTGRKHNTIFMESIDILQKACGFNCSGKEVMLVFFLPANQIIKGG